MARISGIWTGLKGAKWETPPKEAREEIERKFHYFELGQVIEYILKIVLIVIVVKIGISVI